MNQDKLKIPYAFSPLIAVLAAAACAAGLFTPLYRDNALVTAAWRGNDLATLLVIVPLLLVSQQLAQRSSLRAALLWLGSLGYMLYNYVFYLYGSAFNAFFLGYAALVALSLYALVLGLMTVDVEELRRKFSAKTPVKWIGGFLMFIAVMLGGMELSRAASFWFSGQVPMDIIKTGHPTAVVYAADLTLIIPAMALAAVLLWQRRPWGYLLGALMVVKGATYPLALIAMSIYAGLMVGEWDALLPMYAVFFAGCLAALIFLLKNLQEKKEAGND